MLRLLGADEIHPGGEGLIQLELRHALVCARGDRFILRRPSPPETLGGGDILNASPPGRHRRFDEQAIASLHARGTGQAADVFYDVIQAAGAATVREVLERSRLAAGVAQEALHQLLGDGRLTAIDVGRDSVDDDQILVTLPYWSELTEQSVRACAAFHSRFPLRAGLPREELRHQLGLASRTFGLVLERLEAESRLTLQGNTVALPGHEVRFDAAQQTAIAGLLKRFDASPFAPPSSKTCTEAVGSDVFSALKEQGQLVAVSDEVVFRRRDYDAMIQAVRASLAQKSQISLAEVRDLFRTSRKYAQAFLEHLDAIGLTRRDGDVRVLAR
jgi:selenocysteine-specific elongation factor